MEYIFKKSLRAKHLRITIHRDETVTVTVPRNMTSEKAEKFVHKKQGWIEQALANMRRRDKPVVDFPRANAHDFKRYKEEALALVQERLKQFNTFYGLQWNSIAIKNTKSRWGSCSKQKNLNFNYRIVLLSPELANYLVVHELCHLGEFNHSPNFWKLVEQAIPEYRIYRKQLKRIA